MKKEINCYFFEYIYDILKKRATEDLLYKTTFDIYRSNININFLFIFIKIWIYINVLLIINHTIQSTKTFR